MTVVLGLSSILIQTNLAQRKMALVEFASHDYVEITKGASAYIADESAALLKAVKSFIYSTENSETSLENLENQAVNALEPAFKKYAKGLFTENPKFKELKERYSQ